MFDAFDEGGGLGATHHRGEGWGRPGRHEGGAPEVMGGATGRGVTGMAFRDVLQHVYVREAERDAREPADLRQLNGRLLCVLTACHEVDTARRRLMGSLNTQQTLKSLAHLLTARGDAGLGPGTEQRKLTEMLADLRCTVEMATAMWEAAGRHFTRVTRLLPAQLDTNGANFIPAAPAEIDRLALEAQRQGDEAISKTPDGHRTSASDRFARARETYLQAVMDWELAQARWARADRVRQLAEPGCHTGSQGAMAFAQAVAGQEWQRSNLLMREAHACMTRHALYAVALLLPAHFGVG